MRKGQLFLFYTWRLEGQNDKKASIKGCKKIYLQAESRVQMPLVSLDHSCRLFVLDTNLIKLFRVFLLKSDRKFPLLSPHYNLKPPYNIWKCLITPFQPQHTDCPPPQSWQHYYISPTYTPAAGSFKSLLQKGMGTHPLSDHPGGLE